MRLTRRSFLKLTALVSTSTSPTISFLVDALGMDKVDAEKLISFQFSLFRSKDLLDLEYSFINVITDNWVKHNNNDYPKKFSRIKFLCKDDSTKQSYMIVRLPQQHVSELTFTDAEFAAKVKNSVKKSYVSGYSFLVFRIKFDEKFKNLTFSQDNLHNWQSDNFELNTIKEVNEIATAFQLKSLYPLVIQDQYYFVDKNKVPITTLELPYKLYLTPFPGQLAFHSDNRLKEKENTVEVWSNKIQNPQSESGHPSFRVIGFEENVGDYTVDENYLLREKDRQDLTRQFLQPRQPDKPADEVRMIDFRITGLGAITKIRYSQDNRNRIPGDLAGWKQDINFGRDNYVETVRYGTNEKGFKCKYLEIAERQIKEGVSFVKLKYQIIPVEFSKTYFVPNETNVPGKPDNLNDAIVRRMPFQKISIIDKEFPYIEDPASTSECIAPNNVGKTSAFWPKVQNNGITQKDILNELLYFTYEAIDWNGNKIYFKSSVLFVQDILFDIKYTNELNSVTNTYNNLDNKIRREINIAGQKIAYYKSQFKKAIDNINENIISKLSEVETSAIQFLIYQGSDFSQNFPYYPQLEVARTSLPVIKELIKDPRGVLISYGENYLTYGIETAKENAEGILFKIREEKIDPVAKTVKYEAGKIGEEIFKNVSDRLAGIVKPEAVIQAISLYKQAYGMYEGCSEIVDKVNNIRGIARAAIDKILNDAKLFGEIQLTRLLKDSLPLDNFPIAEFKEIYSQVNQLEKIQIAYTWSSGTEVFQDIDVDKSGFVHFFNTNKANPNSSKTDLIIDFLQVININSPLNTIFKSETKLNNFGIGINFSKGSPIIAIYFDSICFKSVTNEKPDVTVAISKVEFSGVLELVKQLQSSLGTFGKGLSFDITSDKILAGYQFSVPAISSGAFNLSNIKLGFEFNLYFRNNPIDFRFRFSEREVPFLLSVGIFGGRGYFGIRVSSRQIEEVEALLEFGGYLGIELGGIARGCVYLLAGIFYSNTGGNVNLYGYLVCGGMLNVLGIIEMSMTFYMGLESHGNEGILNGTASVTVKIRVGFFKIARTVTMTKRLNGREGVNTNYTVNKVNALFNTAKDTDSEFYDECGNPIKVPDDCLLMNSLKDDKLVEEYSSAFN